MINQTRLKTIVYAEGFIEDFIENHAQQAQAKPDVSPKTVEQMTQLVNMWQVLSTGLTDMRQELVLLQNKLIAVKTALET